MGSRTERLRPRISFSLRVQYPTWAPRHFVGLPIRSVQVGKRWRRWPRRGQQSANAPRIFPRSGIGVSLQQNGESMRSLFILVAICLSGTAFAQSAPPKAGNKALAHAKPQAPMGCKFVETVRGTKLRAGDCSGPELRARQVRRIIKPRPRRRSDRSHPIRNSEVTRVLANADPSGTRAPSNQGRLVRCASGLRATNTASRFRLRPPFLGRYDKQDATKFIDLPGEVQRVCFQHVHRMTPMTFLF